MWTTFTLTSECLELSQTYKNRPLGQFFLDHPVELDVEISVSGGQEEIIRADPNDSQPGFPPDVDLIKVLLSEEMTLINSDDVAITFPEGYDITEFLSYTAQDRIAEGVEIPLDDYEPDYSELEAA